MCVFICSKPRVHEWLDVTIARADREALRLWSLCPAQPSASNEAVGQTQVCIKQARRVQSPPARVRSCKVRSCYAAVVEMRSGSAKEWHYPLNAIAHAWNRLLLFLGWRR